MGLLLRGRGLYLLTDMLKILHTLDLCKVVWWLERQLSGRAHAQHARALVGAYLWGFYWVVIKLRK